jgi:hypothetical protein
VGRNGERRKKKKKKKKPFVSVLGMDMGTKDAEGGARGVIGRAEDGRR